MKALKSLDGTDLSQIKPADASVPWFGNRIAREAQRSRAIGIDHPRKWPPDAVAPTALGLECLFARTVESMRLDPYIGVVGRAPGLAASAENPLGVTGRLPPISPGPEV
jgi:hypothetical protein